MSRLTFSISMGVTVGLFAIISLAISQAFDLFLPAIVVGLIPIFLSAIVLRTSAIPTKPSRPSTIIITSLLKLPQQPLSKVKNGWALTCFAASTAYLLRLFTGALLFAALSKS